MNEMSNDVAWDMSEKTIVRQVTNQSEALNKAHQDTFEAPLFEKVKPGGQLKLDAHVNVEMLPQGKYLKKATLFSNVPNGGTWEFMCDEGVAFGGRGSAPSPLMYFSVGIGLCLMSHVEMLAHGTDLDITSVRLEQKTEFTTTVDPRNVDPANVFGKAEYSQMHLVIESPEPEERLAEFVGWCKQACMALQTVHRATPTPVALFVNGNQHDLEA